MSETHTQYLASIDAPSPAEKIAMSSAMLHWVRQTVGRRVVAELGEMPAEQLKWQIALRQYGAEPQARALIEGMLRDVSG